MSELGPLRKPLAQEKRHLIDEIIASEPGISPKELAAIVGEDEVEAYYTNPDAGDY